MYIFVYDMEKYISNSMLCGINDKVEQNLVKYSYLYQIYFAILDSIFNVKC